MGLETGTYISDLVSTNPTGSDQKNTADDHVRLLKATIKATFPNVSGAVTPTHTELNILDGVTATAAELNILDGVTSTAAELNALDGITATVTELNYTDGVTSAIQTQLDAKQASETTGTFTGTLTGCATAPTATFDYIKIGNLVTISARAGGLSATSNSTEMTITGLPVGITPAGSQFKTCCVKDNGNSDFAGACQVNVTNILIFYKLHTTAIQYQTGAFTASGTKGIDADFCITYSLQ